MGNRSTRWIRRLVGLHLMVLSVPAVADYRTVPYQNFSKPGPQVAVVSAQNYAWRKRVVEVAAIDYPRDEGPVTVVPAPQYHHLKVDVPADTHMLGAEERIFEQIERDEFKRQQCMEFGHCAGQFLEDVEDTTPAEPESPDNQRHYLNY